MSAARNGIVTYVDTMRTALREAGNECLVLANGAGITDAAAGVYEVPQRCIGFAERVYSRFAENDEQRLVRRSARHARCIAESLRHAVADHGVDLLEMEESFGFAETVRSEGGPPVAVRLHGPYFLTHFGPEDARSAQRIAAEGDAFRKVAVVTSPSPGVLDAMTEKYGPPAGRTISIPNPVAAPPAADCWRLEDCDRDLIAFVGRFDACKGADIVLAAFSRLAKRRPNVRLAIAGDDNGIADAEGRILKFEAYVAAHFGEALRDKITFLGRVPREETLNLRRRAFIYVSASRLEIHPYAVLEALSLGCPVAASETFGAPEYLANGEEILVAPVGDAEALCDSMERLFADPLRAAEIGAAGRRAVVDRFAPSTIVEQLTGFYRRSLSAAV